MTTLIEQFISESRELLQKVTDALVAYEQSPTDQQLLNEIFRVIHTMKGNSGLFEFPEMTKVLHAGEDLLDALRAGHLPYSHEMADVLLEATDFVVLLTDEIEQQGTIPAHRAQTASEITTRLIALNTHAYPQAAPIAGGPANASADTADNDSPPPELLAQWQRVPPAMRASLAPALAAGQCQWLDYQPEAECFFKGEDPFYLMQQCPEVAWFAVDYVQPNDASMADSVTTDADASALTAQDDPLWDPYQCGLRFMAISSAHIDDVRAHFRYVPEQVSITAMPAEAWKVAAPVSAADVTGKVDDSDAREALRAVALTLLKTQVQVLEQPIEAACFAGVCQAVATTVQNVCMAQQQPDCIAPLAQALASTLSVGEPQPLMLYVAGIYQQWQAAQASTDQVTEAPMTLGANEAEHNKAQVRTDEAHTAKTLKVDQDKIDRLMNLIGEMVVAKNSLPYLADRAENQYGVRELSREIKNQYSVINRIAEEMQQSIMQIRMMPVSFIFQRFPRLVRDTCRKLGKEVNLVLEGEFTEADKLVIEALADPLIHIVRNSLDHGIELPAVRLNKGKPAAGQLLIRASQQTDSVLIEIQDDGKGIDPEVIKRKALEKGLITEAAMQRMTDQQAVNLVFAAGFSTAEVVSDLSGRGVGMDVVRSAIERINGKVTLDSSVDQGTTLRLVLPLSMAITNVIVIESHQQQFGIPMDLVMETVRIAPQDIRQIKQSRAALLRDRIVPLLSLNQLLGLDAPQQLNEQGEVATLVVKINHEYIGLMVDSFKATVDIILKPLPAVLAGMKWYSGSALMGDGSVLMVLNPKELVE